MVSSRLSFTESLHSDIRQEFYGQHEAIAQAMHLVLPGLPLVGVLLHGAVGGVLGLTVFILGYYLMPYAWFATHGSRRV
ncbi:MAG TPA: hypothetical protein VJ805_09415 [Nitrospiraceae bacterium]|nr:hypothetical protein [Nitrospiraceae bacterium]